MPLRPLRAHSTPGSQYYGPRKSKLRLLSALASFHRAQSRNHHLHPQALSVLSSPLPSTPPRSRASTRVTRPLLWLCRPNAHQGLSSSDNNHSAINSASQGCCPVRHRPSVIPPVIDLGHWRYALYPLSVFCRQPAVSRKSSSLITRRPLQSVVSGKLPSHSSHSSRRAIFRQDSSFSSPTRRNELVKKHEKNWLVPLPTFLSVWVPASPLFELVSVLQLRETLLPASSLWPSLLSSSSYPLETSTEPYRTFNCEGEGKH